MHSANPNPENAVIRLSATVMARAQEAVKQMYEEGSHMRSIKLFEKPEDDEGIVSDSSENIIVLGYLDYEGARYYVGLPK